MSRNCPSAQGEGGPHSTDWMEEFNRILREAAARIEPEWFELPIMGGNSVYRERVYCYELYHQMRCLWPKLTARTRQRGSLRRQTLV